MKLFALPALALLGACSTVSDGDAICPGGLVPLGQPVRVGRLVATPLEVVEDSRCPENARCITAGRLIVSTEIEGLGWHETLPLTLGEHYATHGTSITLVTGLPEQQAGRHPVPADYRFAFEGGE